MNCSNWRQWFTGGIKSSQLISARVVRSQVENCWQVESQTPEGKPQPARAHLSLAPWSANWRASAGQPEKGQSIWICEMCCLKNRLASLAACSLQMDLFPRLRLQGQSGWLTVCVGRLQIEDRNSLPSITTAAQTQWVRAGAASICPRFRLRLMRGFRLKPKLVAVVCQCACAKSKAVRANVCVAEGRTGDFALPLSEMICIAAPKPGSTSFFFRREAWLDILPPKNVE
jgi:hypothetical protein